MNMERNTEDILNRCWRLRGSFDDQVNEILDTIRISWVQYESLYKDIENTFRNIWPGCRLEIFGSMLTGLGLKCSDVDGFLHLLENEDPDICVEKCQEWITNHVTPFQQSYVTHKKVPTITFFHPETGANCDLSFNEPIAIEFGKLVRYLFQLDDRAKKLALLVKYWAKINKITGQKLFPSNALIILVIFFLQSKEILPPVASLQNNSSDNIQSIDGWNTDFEKIPYQSYNGVSLFNLMREFFVYYSEFDFKRLLVCPYLGYELDRTEFSHETCIPAAFPLYKKKIKQGNCGILWQKCMISVQDPFVHDRNCSSAVKPLCAQMVIKKFKKAASIFETTPKNEVLNKLLSKHSETSCTGSRGFYQQPVGKFPIRKPRNKNKGRPRTDRFRTERIPTYARGNYRSKKYY